MNYKYTNYMTQEEFIEKLDKCNMVITHAGTGVIINAIKRGKKVIATPRLKEFKEHVDNHQIQLIKEFEELNFIEACYILDDLDKSIKKSNKCFF